MRQEEINQHWNTSSDNYSRIIYDELNSFRVQAWKRQILENYPNKPALNILDAGCGPGFFSIMLSLAGHNVTGIDPAKEMLEKASINAHIFETSPTFVDMDCHQLEFDDNSFDLVVSRNVTHTLCNHAVVYKEWLRVLKPNGRLLIFDANWHLPASNKDLLKETIRRENECLRIYGYTFNGTKRDSDIQTKEPHIIGNNVRPYWDIPILEKVGYTDIYHEKDITYNVWDDKEKLLYGATPLFMISARKGEISIKS